MRALLRPRFRATRQAWPWPTRLLDELLATARATASSRRAGRRSATSRPPQHLYGERGFGSIAAETGPRWGRAEITYQRYEAELVPAGARQRTLGGRRAVGPQGPRRRRSASPGGPSSRGDRQRDPALRGAVELGQDDAGDVDGLVRTPAPGGGRSGPVVASITISVSCGAPSRLLLEHAAHLRQLLHQVRLGVKAPGGVRDDHVGAPRLGRCDRVEDDRARVAARRPADDLARRRARPTPRAARPRPRGRCRPPRRSPTGRAPAAGARPACRSSSSCRCR